MLRKRSLLAWYLGVGFLVTVQAGEAAPHGLLCELLRWPERTVINRADPAFGWIVPGAEAQTAFQIQVAAAPAKFGDPGGKLAWDSGRIPGATSINVRYGGIPLEPHSTYWWRVRVWAGKARGPTPFSEPQRFVTGALDGSWQTPTLPLVETVVAPTRMVAGADGSALIDFGRAAFGYLMLNLSAPGTDAITVRHGEKLAEGRIDMNAGDSIRAGTALLPAGVAGWVRVPFQDPPRPAAARPLPPGLGVVAPFRYAEVDPAAPWAEASRFSMRAVHYPFDEVAADFRSSDARLNEIWALAKYSIKATSFAGIYVDGDRERIPYEADAYINQLGHYAVDREFALARFSHEYLLEHPTWPTEWGFHSIFMAWADYLHTGDPRSLAHHYPRLQDRLQLERFDPATGCFTGFPEREPGSLKMDIIDWPPEERDDHVARAQGTVINAFFHHSLILMERIARKLGRDDDAGRYADMAGRMREKFRAHFFDPARGIFRDGIGTEHASLHASLFPLAFGLVEAHDRASVVNYLKGRGMRCSVYAAQYLLEALFDAREADAALALITARDTDRSWSHMIDSGATITWEAWDKKYKPNLDWNHAWGAAPANLLPRFVLGIRPLSPGFERVLIAPQPGSLAWVDGRVPTIRGPVSVRVKQTDQRVSVEWQTPANMAVSFRYPLEKSRVRKVTVKREAVAPVYSDGWLVLESVPAGSTRVVIDLR